MQDDNFQTLNSVTFAHWNHLESRVSVFWYCVLVIKRYTFHYMTKSATITGNQSSFEILQLFDIFDISSFRDIIF